MPDSHDQPTDKPTGKPTDDDERMQRYLEWRARADRADHSARHRRRRRGAVAGVALAVIGVTAWLLLVPRVPDRTASSSGRGSPTAGITAPPASSPTSDPLASLALERPPAPSEPPSASMAEPRVAPEPRPSTDPSAVRERPAPVRRTARSTAAQGVPRAAAPPSRVQPSDETSKSDTQTAATSSATPNADPGAPSVTTSNERRTAAVSDEAADTSTPTAPATPNEPAPAPPANNEVAATSPTTPNDAPRTPSVTPNAESAATPPASRVDLAAAATEPDEAAAGSRRRACADVMAADGGVRGRSQRAIDCAGRWLKGEADEFSDGVKRQLDNVGTLRKECPYAVLVSRFDCIGESMVRAAQGRHRCRRAREHGEATGSGSDEDSPCAGHQHATTTTADRLFPCCRRSFPPARRACRARSGRGSSPACTAGISGDDLLECDRRHRQ